MSLFHFTHTLSPFLRQIFSIFLGYRFGLVRAIGYIYIYDARTLPVILFSGKMLRADKLDHLINASVKFHPYEFQVEMNKLPCMPQEKKCVKTFS